MDARWPPRVGFAKCNAEHLVQRLVQGMFGDELQTWIEDGQLRFQLRHERQDESPVEAVNLPDGFRSSAVWLADLCAVWCEKFPQRAQSGNVVTQVASYGIPSG